MAAATEIQQEDALKFIVKYLRDGTQSPYGTYGYDLYLPNVMRHYLKVCEGLEEHASERRMREVSPVFYAAAWDLCRRGVMRPGIRRHTEQETRDGSAGNGYSITPFGSQWIAESDRDDFVPTEPERFGQLVAAFHDLLGPGFESRAQEAIRCYGAHAYLACCAMCGAAAESVLLRIAIAKVGDDASVLKDYASAGGRSKVENRILGQAKQYAQADFRAFTMLLKYWRDEAAHGTASMISDVEAYTSLALLLRFAMYTRDHWKELTAR